MEQLLSNVLQGARLENFVAMGMQKHTILSVFVEVVDQIESAHVRVDSHLLPLGWCHWNNPIGSILWVKLGRAEVMRPHHMKKML